MVFLARNPSLETLDGDLAPSPYPIRLTGVSMRTLINFDENPSEPRWVAVNDDVMGGCSRGGPLLHDGLLHFSGELSLANNGGFASVRTVDYAVNLSGASVIVLRVRGDGRRYQLRLSTHAQYRGIAVSYSAEFVSAIDEWTEFRPSLDSLQPSVRGTLLSGPPFEPAQVQQIGLLIGDKQAGPFSLAIDWIGVE